MFFYHPTESFLALHTSQYTLWVWLCAALVFSRL